METRMSIQPKPGSHAGDYAGALGRTVQSTLVEYRRLDDNDIAAA